MTRVALLLAVVCGAATYMLMNFVMTAAPLAMIGCNHSVDQAAYGIQWHVIAMYAPSFFTGNLIVRYGAPRVVALGLVLTAMAAVVALLGITVPHFYLSLVFLGLGWNFGYIGASAMVAATARPEERTRVCEHCQKSFGTLVAISNDKYVHSPDCQYAAAALMRKEHREKQRVDKRYDQLLRGRRIRRVRRRRAPAAEPTADETTE